MVKKAICCVIALQLGCTWIPYGGCPYNNGDIKIIKIGKLLLCYVELYMLESLCWQWLAGMDGMGQRVMHQAGKAVVTSTLLPLATHVILILLYYSFCQCFLSLLRWCSVLLHLNTQLSLPRLLSQISIKKVNIFLHENRPLHFPESVAMLEASTDQLNKQSSSQF